MTLRRPSRLSVLTAALLVLLPTLAVMQYRWAGQLSDAERERMQRNMRTAAAQFRDAFDHEIARAFMALQVDGAIVRDQGWDRYAERYAAWLGTATYPSLIANVYLVDGDGSRVRLRRWNATARMFESARWEPAIAAARPGFEEDLAAHRAGNVMLRRGRRPFTRDESLLVAPVMNVHIGPSGAPMHMPFGNVFGYTVLQLNLSFIREQLLPQLAERHFTHTDDAAYRAAVVDAADPRRVIYRSSPEARADPARADAVELLFPRYGDSLMFLARGALRPRPDQRDAETAAPHNVFVSVIREKRDVSTGVRTQIVAGSDGRWRLLLQHERGSLEAAVAAVRQRNLLVSFGILLLMGVSIGLLALSSRRAQRLARQQMEFIAGVSHELRTPVAVIRSAAENLSHGVVGDADRVRRYGDVLQAEARRLGEMVERVLQFAGIGSGRATLSAPVDVKAVVDGALDAAVAADPDIRVERRVASELPLVLGHAEMLRSAVQNLLANASKYGGADRWIGVRVEADGTGRARELRVAIEDHGGGIAPADLPHIFEPFYRGADAVARQIQGSGLGLALVRRIAEAHGGRVTVASRPGEGCAFTLHLPTAPAHQAASFGVGSIVESMH